ncbi:beta family protein [Flagellimonas lutimaris]|uniref:beta family protein n=1 Tax=Flagellimonas lutimaris TaxID=475082 RepID=UPI0039C401A2
MKNYYPILVSKNGETVALQHLEQKIKNNTCPVIEVINSTIVKFKKDKETKDVTMYYSDKFEKFLKTHWNFPQNEIILDFSRFNDWGEHQDFIKESLIRLYNNGVNIILSVQTNSHQNYIDMVKELVYRYNCNLCFRFSNSSGGFLHLNSDINELLKLYRQEIEKVLLLVDLGQIEYANYNMLGSSVGIAIKNLNYQLQDFESVILASSSFPAALTEFSAIDDAHEITRYEWLLFNNLAREDLSNIKYGDYGTKTADFKEIKYMGSVSLKYSTPEKFIIYRGVRTVDHELGHNQYISHTKKLVENPNYSGNGFSWGDLKYYETSRKDLYDGSPGNSTQWVQFSQNHHITLMNNIL